MIITEDSGSERLSDWLSRQTNIYNDYDYGILQQKLNNIFDVVLQGIYTLNVRLNIQHNDMHFGNILIKSDLTEYETILINNKKTYIESYYKISIYDFDRAYYKNHDNALLNELCNSGNGCNNLSFKDSFVFIQSIISIYINSLTQNTYSLLSQYLRNLINALILKESHRNKLIDNMNKILKDNSVHWSAYCMHIDNQNKIQMGYPCNPPNIIDTYVPWLKDIYTNFMNYVKNNRKDYYKYQKQRNGLGVF